MLPAGPEILDYPVADDQVFVVQEIAVFVFAGQVVGAVQLEAGFHSGRSSEAVSEEAAPVRGCHSLRSKDLCCRRGLCNQTRWAPIYRKG